MQKTKLRNIRQSKGYTQQQLADVIYTDVSNYSRKENGITAIIPKEWDKLAAFLQVERDDIFEEDEKQVSIVYENSTLTENSGNLFSTYYNIPDSLLKNLQDFIAYLQKENQRLTQELDAERNNKQ
ncbi:MAG: helix-turn-helix domain-containing protein [Tannerella sp.]|jgi:transcriptional regulator with XRE-family HTH domain|nr:helix-turn-helix domain-containing protein [Tannerella sp.]